VIFHSYVSLPECTQIDPNGSCLLASGLSNKIKLYQMGMRTFLCLYWKLLGVKWDWNWSWVIVFVGIGQEFVVLDSKY